MQQETERRPRDNIQIMETFQSRSIRDSQMIKIGIHTNLFYIKESILDKDFCGKTESE
jgi:hypothetical protein